MRLLWIVGVALLAGVAAMAGEAGALEGSTLLAVKGRVEMSRAGTQVWDPAATNITLRVGDRLRTLESSRATLRLRDATIVNVNELTALMVAPESGRSVIELLRGVISFFHRDEPGDAEVRGGSCSAIIRGTEFVAAVDAEGKLSLLVFEGSVEVTNGLGKVSAQSGEAVTASANSAPTKSPSLTGTNRTAIQWTLYYPAILNPDDVTLDERWKTVVEHYRSGDLWRAANEARSLGAPKDDSERLMHAALRLAVGDVPGMRENLAGARASRLGVALEEIVHAVQFEPCDKSAGTEASSATEWMAISYCRQSEGRIGEALEAAKRAVTKAPEFGFAQARVAELEFASGHVDAAKAALDKALRQSPRLGSAVALEGFVLAAAGKFEMARGKFHESIALDSGLGDAWLGRGLVRFHQGDRVGGRVDMEAAAAIEPQRSVLRSYLGKAFAEEGLDARALAELDLAERLDAKDPTALLYAALIRYRRYELARAIGDVEESSARNANRAVFRSGMLLDEDAAVRSANLAHIFELADMPDVARRESTRAVMFDYANFSAHLNLASSFNALRDPTRFNLRNETVWFNEHLLASLLAPPNAAPLSQNLSQNEYSRLFARNRFGFSSTTEYFGTGEFRELATQSGNFDDFSYALDLDSDFKAGERPNNDLTRIEWYSRAKIAITPADSLLLLTKYEDFDSGDNFQNAAQTNRPNFRFKETQTPLALAGYHHEWNPGSHTLFLGGRLQNEQRFSDLSSPELVAFSSRDPQRGPFNVASRNEFVIYTAEANQILESESHTTIFGGRLQTGTFKATADLDDAPLGGFAGAFGGATHSVGDANFNRRSAYGYHTWEIVTDLWLTAGLSFDDITSPLNYRRPPLQSGETHRNQWSPKAALVYAPSSLLTLRGMYAQSLGGVSYDESVTLEPTQLAGFPQSFRTLISESLVGSVELPRYDVGGVGVDFKFPTGTYLSIEGTSLESAVDRQTGIFNFDPSLNPPGMPGLTDERLRYAERGARLNVSQILGREWFANAAYQFTRSELRTAYPTIVATPSFARETRDQSDMHRFVASVLYQRQDGWFGRGAVVYLHQDNTSALAPKSEDFAELNLYAGWRFPHLHGAITVGVLNLGDFDYHLHPLNPYEEFPRTRTVYVRLDINL